VTAVMEIIMLVSFWWDVSVRSMFIIMQYIVELIDLRTFSKCIFVLVSRQVN